MSRAATRNEERRRRRLGLFLLASLGAHLGLAGLFAAIPAPAANDREDRRPIPLAFFTPGEGSASVASAQAPADERGAVSAAPPRRAATRALAPVDVRRERGSAAPPPTDPEGSTTAEATGLGEDEAADAFLDALMEGSGPRRPQPGACPDPVIGTWRASRFDPAMNKRAEFLLRVREHHEGRIQGRITLRAWSGRSPSPPRCSPGVFFHTVRMPARGTFEGGRFRFDAQSFTRLSHCADPGFAYNLDHFSGSLGGDRLRAVNNDGGHEVDTPYAFERIACQ